MIARCNKDSLSLVAKRKKALFPSISKKNRPAQYFFDQVEEAPIKNRLKAVSKTNLLGLGTY